MTESIQPAVSAVQERFGARLQTFRGETSLALAANRVIPAAQVLHDEFGSGGL